MESNSAPLNERQARIYHRYASKQFANFGQGVWENSELRLVAPRSWKGNVNDSIKDA